MTAKDEMSARALRGFWTRVDRSAGDKGCWPWLGVMNQFGYGRFTYIHADGRPLATKAHRIAWELHRGPVPEGLVLDHLCRNTACVNPHHLEPVTQQTNSRRGSRYQGGSIEAVGSKWRAVWREDGRKRYRTFDTEPEAQVFVAERFLRERGVA